ncbi:Bacterial membrane protein YfhO [anaerobic digester metagenome]
MKEQMQQQFNNLIRSVRDGSIWNHSLLRFILIGVFNTFHFWLWYNLFLKLSIAYPVAFTLGFVLSMIGSFFLNTYFTFKTKPTLKKFIRFPLTTLPNYLISQAGLWLLVEQLHLAKNISGLLASLAAIPVTYLVTRLILTREEGTPVSSASKYDSPYQLQARKLGEKMRWLDTKDLLILAGLILFSLLLHRYIFKSGFLYGDDHTDSTVQMIFFLPYLIKEVLIKGHFWAWTYGMGGDIFSEFSYYYTTAPIIWSLLPLFKTLPESWYTLENSLNLKLFISIYKQVWIMALMYGLLRYEKRSRGSSFAAALVYGGGIYYMWNANFFDFMTDAYLWVPLMVLGYRIWERRRNFWPLVISAALAAINNYYFAYHTYLFFILFVLIMAKSPNYGRSLREKAANWFREVGGYAWQGIAALLLSMFAFLPAAFAFLRIDRFDTVNPVSLFYSQDFYMNMPINLFFNNSTLGIPMLIILALFINYRRTSELTDRKIFLLLTFLILYMLPFTGYFLNGMNYHSERWFYLLLFVFSYVLADILDEMKKPHHFNLFWLGLIFIGSSVLIYLRWDVIKGFDDKDKYVAVLLFNLAAFLLIALRQQIRQIKWRKVSDAVVVLLIFGIMVGNNLAYAGDQNLNLNSAKMETEKMKSPELIDIMSRVVPSENEFFRTVFRNNRMENATTYYDYYGISTFSSMTDGNMHDWIKRILNIRHDIVYLSSFNNLDDRLYLEGLLGVKYLITENGSYEPVPYYKKVYSNQKYTLYVNEYTVGMDLWFEEELPVTEVYQMIKPDMDMNLMHFAITEGKPILPQGTPVRSEEIPLTDSVMTFDKVYFNGQRIEFDEGGAVTFTIPEPYDTSQLYLHNYLRPEDQKEFDQTVNKKTVFKSYESNPYVYYTNNWTWALNGNEPSIRWTAAKKSYEIKDFYLHRVDLSDYEQLIEQRNKYNMENLVVSGNHITGTITNTEKGILVLNIPYNKGWTVKDNGKPLPIERMNGILSGIALEPGTHELIFQFRSYGFIPGLIITLLTLIALVGYDVWRRRTHKLILPVNPQVLSPIVPLEDSILASESGQGVKIQRRSYLRPELKEPEPSVPVTSPDLSGACRPDDLEFDNRCYSLPDELKEINDPPAD